MRPTWSSSAAETVAPSGILTRRRTIVRSPNDRGRRGPLSELYDEAHRSFQDQHDSRRLADRLESLAHSEFEPNDRAFIESLAMFFLSTVDARGRPTVSYKGGAPGFVRVVGASELVFPVYDGNGMYLSLGNI